MMKCHAFRLAALLVTLPLVAAPFAAGAQQPGKTYRVALILATSPVAVMMGRDPAHPYARAFLHEMRDRGYVEGQNLVFARRSLEGKAERGPEVVAELVRGGIDVIVVPVNPIVRDAKRVTTTVPIVMVYGSSPVSEGLVTSLARPGGNVTGLTNDAGPEIEAKRAEMLKAAVPRLSRVAYVGTKADWTSEWGQSTRAAAQVLGLTLFLAEPGPHDYASAFDTIRHEHADALIMASTPHHFTYRQLIAEFARKNRLPSISRYREFVEAGGLMSYGADVLDNYRRAAWYVDKILRGAKPADMPIEQPTKFELVINLKSAKALGVTIPPSVLLRADQVIE